MKRLCIVLAVIAALPPASAFAGADAIHLASRQTLDSRLTEYHLTTPALSGETIARVLLPADYAANPTKRYPVLYLLNGCCDFDVDGSQAWTTHGDAEKLTAGLPVIVVMPAGGKGGFYSDWYNNGLGGTPMWETYHIDELIPWVDQQFRTVAGRSGRAVAGLSMGGFGAMSYASRHPDLFVAAASFSGAVDTADPVYGTADESLSALDGGLPGSVWGPRATELIRWRAHNPNDLAENLQGLNLTLRTGNGDAGGDFGGGPDPVEMAVHQQTLTFDATLKSLGYPHVMQDYGPGAHQWPYWARDLQLTLPTLMATFAQPPAPPAKVRFKAVEDDYSVYGWHVSMDRPVLEFSELADADRAGFTLSGSGTGVVTTPPVYAPRVPVRVTIGGKTADARTDAAGRLTVTVPLGPANTVQADRVVPTTVYKTQVAITTPRTGTHGRR